MSIHPRGARGRALALCAWLPVAGAAAYLGLLAVSFDRVLGAVYSNSDAASPGVIAQCLLSPSCGKGRVVLGHISYFTTLWFDLLTGWLPFHRAVWEAGPYLCVVLGVALLAWAAWVLSGPWAATVTAAIALAMSAAVLYASVAPAFHGTTWLTTVALGTYLVWATARPRGVRARIAAIAALSCVAAVNLASDPLLAVTGIVPLVAAPLVVWVRRRRPDDRAVALDAGVIALLTIVGAAATTVVMQAFGFGAAQLNGAGFGLVAPGAFGGRVLRLIDDLAALTSAGPVEHGSVVGVAARVVLAAAAVVALGLVLRAGVVARGGVEGDRAVRPRTLYGVYWALCAVALCGWFLLSDLPLGAGTPSSRYVVGLLYVAAACVPLWAARSSRRRAVVGLLVAGLCVLGSLALVRNDLGLEKARLPVVQYGGALVAAVEREGLGRGYADYWKAAALSWRTAGRVLVAPVTLCAHGRPARLCPFRLNSISGWYRPHPRAWTFLVVDPHTDPIAAAIRSIGRPVQVQHFGPLRVLVYAHDLAAGFGR